MGGLMRKALYSGMVLCLLFPAVSGVAQSPAGAPVAAQDARHRAETKAAELVSGMTLEEKISQMQNASPAIPHLGIPAYNWWNEGLHGIARSGYATVFPRGLQGDDPNRPMMIATPKHFAVHSGPESSRHHFDATPTPKDLEETYLPAFRASVTEGHAGSLMCAYNKLDGTPACANGKLLANTLREAWHFRGFVTSDCGAVYDMASADGNHFAQDQEHASALAVRAGTDTTCGTEYR